MTKVINSDVNYEYNQVENTVGIDKKKSMIVHIFTTKVFSLQVVVDL